MLQWPWIASIYHRRRKRLYIEWIGQKKEANIWSTRKTATKENSMATNPNQHTVHSVDLLSRKLRIEIDFYFIFSVLRFFDALHFTFFFWFPFHYWDIIFFSLYPWRCNCTCKHSSWSLSHFFFQCRNNSLTFLYPFSFLVLFFIFSTHFIPLTYIIHFLQRI